MTVKASEENEGLEDGLYLHSLGFDDVFMIYSYVKNWTM